MDGGMEGWRRRSGSSVADLGPGSAADREMEQDGGVMNARSGLPRLMLSVQTPGGTQGGRAHAHV